MPIDLVLILLVTIWLHVNLAIPTTCSHRIDLSASCFPSDFAGKFNHFPIWALAVEWYKLTEGKTKKISQLSVQL